MAEGAQMPEKQAGGNLAGEIAGFLKWVIELLWIRDPTIARPVTIISAIVFLSTIGTLVFNRDEGGLALFVILFVLITAAFVFLYMFLAPAVPTGATPAGVHADARSVRPWPSRLITVLNICLSLIFAASQATNLIPAVGRVFDSLGLQQLLSPSCLLRPLSDCGILLKEISETAAASSDGSAPNSPPAPTVPRDTYTVYIQFTGLTRDQIKTLATDLHGSGWNVPSYSAGGEEIATAKGRLEVRYGNPGDQAAADLLAAEISATKVTAAPLTSKLLPIIHKGVLEVWISG